jgi:hypothetical protein
MLVIGAAERLRKWIRQTSVNAGTRPCGTTEEATEIACYAA